MPHGSIIYELAENLGDILTQRKIRCAIAESCTGGALGGTITSIPGSSDWFDRGFITYSNEAKEEMLGVPHKILRAYGAVSEQAARAMAEGAIANSDANVSVAITGIAGPGGGSRTKPVGTVWIAWAGDLQPTFSHCYHFVGNRPAVRHQAIQRALDGLIHRCDPKSQPLQQKKTKDRYFFALFPNEEVANALYQQGKSHILDEICTEIPKSKLHLTLSYLGNVPPDFLQEAMRIASSIKAKSFDMEINKVDAWQHPKICWLGCDCPPEELVKLAYHLNLSLISAGFRPERNPFIPHVTIARKWTRKEKAKSIDLIPWFVDEFCLVKSTRKAEALHYEIIARWSLKRRR